MVILVKVKISQWLSLFSFLIQIFININKLAILIEKNAGLVRDMNLGQHRFAQTVKP